MKFDIKDLTSRRNLEVLGISRQRGSELYAVVVASYYLGMIQDDQENNEDDPDCPTTRISNDMQRTASKANNLNEIWALGLHSASLFHSMKEQGQRHLYILVKEVVGEETDFENLIKLLTAWVEPYSQDL